jgi:hypothetical protein
MESFQDQGIQVLFHDYAQPSYTQIHPGFEPGMSVIDLLFNHGDIAPEIIRSGRCSPVAVPAGEVL